VKDPATLALLKRIVCLLWSVELWLRRVLGFRRRWRFWELVGDCNGCGSCCVEPSIHVGWATWNLAVARWLFLAWQQRVNGFELQGQDEESHDLLFRCTHYDPVSKRCDSYASRPSMCRRYPKVLLDQAWPELFDACSYRVRPRRHARMRASIDATSLSPEAKAELRRKLRLD